MLLDEMVGCTVMLGQVLTQLPTRCPSQFHFDHLLRITNRMKRLPLVFSTFYALLSVLLLTSCDKKTEAPAEKPANTFMSNEKDFSVNLPDGFKDLKPTKNTIPSEYGDIPSTYYQARTKDGNNFSIWRQTFPDGFLVKTTGDAILDSKATSFAQQMGPGTVLAPVLSLNGMPGRTLSFALGKDSASRLTGLAYLYLAGRNFYMLQYIAKKPEDLNRKDVQGFFGSFTPVKEEKHAQ